MNIYIIDPHPLMREAVTIQIRRLQSASAIFEAANLSEFAAISAKNGTPDLITSELDLTDSAGLSTVTQLKALYPHCPLVVFTTASAALLEDAAIAAGADVFIQKTTPTMEVSAALKALLSKESELDTQFGTMGKLSKRQKQLMIMLQEGLSNRDIAAKIEISEHTVKIHLWRLFRKLGVNSRTQALHFGRSNGLI